VNAWLNANEIIAKEDVLIVQYTGVDKPEVVENDIKSNMFV